MSDKSINRRKFVTSAAVGAAAALSAPGLLRAQGAAQDTDEQEAQPSAPESPAIQTDSRTDDAIYVGNDEHRYQVQHNFVQLPDPFTWQTTHNVAVDKSGNIYVIHEGDKAKTDHPAIFVFDSTGAYVRSFGSGLQGGGHGLEIREENGEEFIYASAYLSLKFITKMNLTGEQVWKKFAPMESGIYAADEVTVPNGEWGRNRYMPTNFAFLDDGGFLVADGYGSWTIHRHDADGNFVSHFGIPETDKTNDEDGHFNLPHGIWIDDREDEKTIVVADRANMRLQWFTMDGTHLRTQDGFLLPANIDIRGDLMLVPELQAQLTLLNKDNSVAAVLGGDPDWRASVLADNNEMRRHSDRWADGQFIHPHDACFDLDGNIIVAEWVEGGRISRLLKV